MLAPGQPEVSISGSQVFLTPAHPGSNSSR